jgi:Fic family protein
MRTRYVDIDDRHKDLAARMRRAPEVAEGFLRKWDLSWLYHENALEGAVYSSQELELALENQPVADASFLGALRELRNHKAALDLVRQEARAKRLKVNVALLKRLFETLGAGIEGRSTVQWRTDMPLHRTYFHEIAQPARIQPDLAKLLEGWNTAEVRATHPVQQAVKIHHGLVQVFPFTEQSGRIGRLLANMVLFQAGYLPVIIHATDRQRYYETFKQGEATLRDLTMDAIENGLEHAEKSFAQVETTSRKGGARKLAR